MSKPVGLVTVSIIAKTVRSLTPAMMRSITVLGSSIGKGMLTVTTTAPQRSATKSMAFLQA